MTRRRAAPPPAPAGDGEPWTRSCLDCVPELWIQGGAWGWKAHRYALHGEGEDPGSHPAPAQPSKKERPPWTDAERAEFHRRRMAASRRARHAPPPRTPRPPTGGHYPAGPR